MKRPARKGNKISMKIRRGETLIISGPCSLELGAGAVECFGGVWTPPLWVTLRPFKQYHFYAHEETSDVSIQGAGLYRIEKGDPVPASWRELVTKVAEFASMKAFIVGPPGAGKSTLSTFLANQLLTIASSVDVIDADLGQNDIGPPGTVSVGVVRRQIIDLGRIKPYSMKFVGFLSPSVDPDRLESAIVSLVSSEPKSDFIIINSDGWVSGMGLTHKSSLISKVKPEIVVSLLDEGQNLELGSSSAYPIIRVERSPLSMIRTVDTRRAHRDAVFLRYLLGGRSVTYDLNRVSFVGSTIPKSGSLVGLLRGGELLGLGIFEGVRNSTHFTVYTKLQEMPDSMEVGLVDLEHLLSRMVCWNLRKGYML